MSLLLIFLLPAALAAECNRYTWDDGRHGLGKDDCIAGVREDGYIVYYVKPCTNPNKSVCPMITGVTGIFSWEQANPFKIQAYPGERCGDAVNAECVTFGSKCENGICKGLSKGMFCTEHGCNPGLFCDFDNTQTCVKAGDHGDFWNETTWQCKNNYDCQSSECQDYLRSDEGDKCSQGEECESLTCAELPTGGNRCIDSPVSLNTPPYKCEADSECQSIYFGPWDHDYFSGTCDCGFNSNGDKYCSIHEGDDPHQKLIALTKEWIQSTYINNCNTFRRLHPWCLQSHMPAEAWQEFNYYSQQVFQYSFYQDLEPCVRKTFFASHNLPIKPPSYNHTYYEQSVDDWGNFLGVTIFLLLT